MERVWTPPCTACADVGAQPAQLVLYNSLVDRKVPFVPAAGADSKQITWYTCGKWPLPPPARPPAAAHLAHEQRRQRGHVQRRLGRGGEVGPAGRRDPRAGAGSGPNPRGDACAPCRRLLSPPHTPTRRTPRMCIQLASTPSLPPTSRPVATPPHTHANARTHTHTTTTTTTTTSRRPHRLRLSPRGARPQLPLL